MDSKYAEVNLQSSSWVHHVTSSHLQFLLSAGVTSCLFLHIYKVSALLFSSGGRCGGDGKKTPVSDEANEFRKLL